MQKGERKLRAVCSALVASATQNYLNHPQLLLPNVHSSSLAWQTSPLYFPGHFLLFTLKDVLLTLPIFILILLPLFVCFYQNTFPFPHFVLPFPVSTPHSAHYKNLFFLSCFFLQKLVYRKKWCSKNILK